MKGYIYKIINKENNKFYIGSSFNIEKRKNAHFNALRNGKHHSIYLQRAYNKYGEKAFVFTVVKEYDLETENELRLIEERYINDRQWYEPKIIGIDWYETDNDKMKMERSQNAKLSGWNAKSLQDFLNDREKYYGKINLNKISNFRYSNIAENIIRQLVKETIEKIINML